MGIENNKNRIKSHPEQEAMPYNEEIHCYAGNDLIDEFLLRFKNSKIYKSDILYLINSDELTLALIAIMAWGGIATNHKNGSGKSAKERHDDLGTLLEMGHDKLQTILSTVRDLVFQDNIEEAFKYLETEGEGKITGVAHSFHTKILYFFGLAAEKLTYQPLIFDSFTKNAFYFLLSQLSDGEENKHFSRFDMKKNRAIVRTGHQLRHAYMRYIECMNIWAKQIKVTPMKLEEFLFGQDSRKQPTIDNARVEIISMIRKNLT